MFYLFIYFSHIVSLMQDAFHFGGEDGTIDRGVQTQ
jgi:hypothetical protein